MRTKFRKDWFRHSKVNRGDTHTQQCDLISIFCFFQNTESRLKINYTYMFLLYIFRQKVGRENIVNKIVASIHLV
jgi:hypothetical protein